MCLDKTLHIQSALPTGDGLWPLPRHMWWRFRKVAAFARLCVFGGLCVDMWRLLHQWSFFCCLTVFDYFWLFLWRLVHCSYSLGRHVTINTSMVIFAVLTVFDCFFDEWYTVPIVKNTQNHWCTIVTGLPRLYQQCTNGVTIVKNSQKQSKDSQNSKHYHWCTNCHISTKTLPTVYQSSKTVKRQSKQQKWPLVYQSSQVYQDCTNSVPTVYGTNRQKQSKDSQNGKNDHWCTNHHSHVYTESAEYTKPRV